MQTSSDSFSCLSSAVVAGRSLLADASPPLEPPGTSYGGQSGIRLWIDSVSSYYIDRSGGRTGIDSIDDFELPANPFNETGNFNGFAFAFNFANAPVVGINSVSTWII